VCRHALFTNGNLTWNANTPADITYRNSVPCETNRQQIQEYNPDCSHGCS
jgi:hypothetical protein